MPNESSPFSHWSFYDLGNQLVRHVTARVFCALDTADHRKRDILRAGDLAALHAHKRQVRDVLIGSAGYPAAPPSPGPARVQDETSAGGLRIQRLVFDAVPALYYTRLDQGGKRPGILFLCGHERDGMHNPRYQHICRLLALNGFAVLCPEVFGQGERLDAVFTGPTAQHNAAGLAAMGAGQNLARILVADAMAAVSVLQAMDEVNAGHIAVTGNSGGGTQSMLTALADERIGAAAIGTFLSSQREIFKSGKPQDAEQIWPGTLRGDLALDHDDLLWAFSPKPVLILAAEEDFFPFEGTLATAQSARAAYRLQGAEDHFALYSEKTSHRYTDGMACAAAGFFARHFGFAAFAISEADIRAAQAGTLRAPQGDAAAFSHTAASQKRFQSKEKTTHGPVGIGPRQNVTPLFAKTADRFTWNGLGCRRILWTAQPDLCCVTALFGHAPPKPNPITLFLWEGGTSACDAHADQILKACAKDGAAAVCDLIAMGVASPNPVNNLPLQADFGTLYHLNAWLLRLGDSLAALRTQSLLTALRLLRQELGFKSVTIHAQGHYRLYAEYAALCQPDSFAIEGGGTGLPALARLLRQPAPDQRLWPFVLPGILSTAGTSQAKP